MPVIIDEAIGVEGPIWDAIEGARAGGNVHQLVLFNPTIPAVRVDISPAARPVARHHYRCVRHAEPGVWCINTKTSSPSVILILL